MTEPVAPPLPPHCGYPLNGGFHAGCGCAKPFSSWNEVYRCADCTLPMHRRCLIEHFADGKQHEAGDGYGTVRSPTFTLHHFAMQIAWIAKEVTERDDIIKKLTCESVTEGG